MKTIFVTGATGLVGSHLVKRLLERGDQPVVLTRSAAAARGKLGERVEIVEGNPAWAGSWGQKAAVCDGGVNLAGESIFGKRWNDEQKAILRASRVEATKNLVAAMKQGGHRAKVLVSASAVGYYGPRGDEELDESAAAGDDFLAKLCVEWEAAAREAEKHGIRVAVLRFGVVLAKEGGALAQMLPPFRRFVGGPIGSGRQWFSWIHVDDLVGILLLALDNPGARGAINATAPGVVRNKEFARALGSVLGRPSFFRVPKLALRLALGEVAGVLTTGQRAVPRAAEALGYEFRFPGVKGALEDLVG